MVPGYRWPTTIAESNNNSGGPGIKSWACINFHNRGPETAGQRGSLAKPPFAQVG